MRLRSMPALTLHAPLLFSVLFSVLFSAVTAETISAAPPNVVLIMTDNHGAWTLGCYGNRDIRTPNIDQLADEGTLFTRAFASNPVCSPTRATVLTGLVPSQHGVHSFLTGGRLQTGPEARCTLDAFRSLPEVLRDAGYACGLVGKWHLGGNLQPQEGFDDYWITMPHGGTSTFYDAQIIEDGKIRKEPTYLTDFWTEHAVKFINQRARKEKPFFLFLAYNGPYALSRLLLRDGRNRHAEYYADKPIDSFPRTTPHPWQLNNLDYINNPTSIRRVATEVSGIDDGVGSVMEALRASGIDDDTIVIFVADQGWVGGHGGFFGMGDHTRPLTARDGMMQIPLILRHPHKIAAGRRSDKLIANYDVMPTLLGHLDLGDRMPAEPRSPGTDYSPLLAPETAVSRESIAADKDEPQDAVFYEFENLRCIRTATHKYVHRHPNGPHELYDLRSDPQEFVNLADKSQHAPLRRQLKTRLDQFYATYSLPEYDMWRGGTSQVRIHDGIDEEMAQREPVEPPPLSDGFQPAPLDLPDGYSATVAAGPPLVTHPTMACLDDQGRLYVCNNAGVNMTNKELEDKLPNSIRRLVDSDGDGRYDSWTLFADKMTFPMGGVWRDGSLYVASPPNIWKLTDTDDDGVADKREILVNKFGYNGNAASIHGCFAGPDGRIYWTDGYHGHEFQDDAGNITSQREGSYLFSCRSDGSDVQIHCGGGMDNPVEIDFTDSGEMLGTVNILYTRPRVDCLVHWLYGGAYPHREKVLNEIKVTGDLLGPAHRFGHVAVSGMTRYRSGTLDHRWGDDLFVTFFNQGKVIRLDLQPNGSTFGATQHEFLSSASREFHPTDVLEDADGSLLVIDTGGWFYRGCPTSQFSKPELLGAIYRIRRDGMTTQVDPRGNRIDWKQQTPALLVRLFNDTRFEVRRRAVDECVKRGSEMIPTLKSMVVRGDIRVRQNCVWALTRLSQQPESTAVPALRLALEDRVPSIRQAACRGLGQAVAGVQASWVTGMLGDPNAGVRRQAAETLGRIGDAVAVESLVAALGRSGIDRSEEHAIVYAMIAIGDASSVRKAAGNDWKQHAADPLTRGVLVALDQIDNSQVEFDEFLVGMASTDRATQRIVARMARRHPNWGSSIADRLRRRLMEDDLDQEDESIKTLLSATLEQPEVAAMVGQVLRHNRSPRAEPLMLGAIAGLRRQGPHASWIRPLAERLADDNDEVAAAAVKAAAALSGNQFQHPLQNLADDEARPLALRMDALAAVASQTGRLDDATWNRLIDLYRSSGSPTAAGRAAQIIGASQPTAHQLQQITPLMRHASPMELRDFVRVFQRKVDEETADHFLTAIESADSLLSLPDHEFSDVIKRFPRDRLERGNAVLDRLMQHRQQKQLRLEKLRDRLGEGDELRGRRLFASEKAKCSGCHKIGAEGKAVGPDLTTIGANRSAKDLLESIVFPSASIVRDYQSHKLLTVDGRAMAGLVVSESSDAIVLQQANGETVSLPPDEIEQITPSAVSIMPAGLDEALSETELLDVVTYLQSLQ